MGDICDYPCSKCSEEVRAACCGCGEYFMWKKKNSHKKDRHEVRVKNNDAVVNSVRDLMKIQEDYIVWLEKQIETLSGMDMDSYCIKNPR